MNRRRIHQQESAIVQITQYYHPGENSLQLFSGIHSGSAITTTTVASTSSATNGVTAMGRAVAGTRRGSIFIPQDNKSNPESIETAIQNERELQVKARSRSGWPSRWIRGWSTRDSAAHGGHPISE